MSDEKSYFWDGFVTGDARLGPHPSNIYAYIWDLFYQEYSSTQGPIKGYLNELEVTNPAGNTIRLATGSALVKGRGYINDANIDWTIDTPLIADRIDRVVIRSDIDGQEVRADIVTGTPGGGVPGLDQDNDYWEIPIAQVGITTGGVITITDEREFAQTRLQRVPTDSAVILDSYTTLGTENEITFDDISQDYTDLMILGMLRHSDITGIGGETAWTQLGVRINQDGTNLYETLYDAYLYPLAGAPALSTSEATGLSYGDCRYIASANAVANVFSPIHLIFTDYKSPVFYKQMRLITSVIAGTPDPAALHNVGCVYKSLSAIEKITLFNPNTPASNFVAGSKVILIGMKGSV